MGLALLWGTQDFAFDFCDTLGMRGIYVRPRQVDRQIKEKIWKVGLTVFAQHGGVPDQSEDGLRPVILVSWFIVCAQHGLSMSAMEGHDAVADSWSNMPLGPNQNIFYDIA
jgi:hypothetical protein